MTGFETEPSIDFMDTLVPVTFITPTGEVHEHLFAPAHARDPELISAIAETYKHYSFDEVVTHVGYSRAEGGTPSILPE